MGGRSGSVLPRVRCACALGLLLVLAACGAAAGEARDAALDVPPVVDAPDARPSECLGADGLPCLRTGGAAMPALPRLSCAPREPDPGSVAPRRLRLVSRGFATTPVPAAALEVWPENAVGATCTAPACVALVSDGEALATVDLDDGFFAYRVPQNAAAMTYTTLGYHRTASRDGATDVVTIPAALFMTPCGTGACLPAADPADGILHGAVSDCASAPMRGVTIRLFDSSGAEIDTTTAAPLAAFVVYRRDGVLPSASLMTTDHSGGFTAGNVPLLADVRVAVVAYGTTEMDGVRAVVGCEEVVLGTNSITLLDLGPYRSDYAAGNLCLEHAPGP